MNSSPVDVLAPLSGPSGSATTVEALVPLYGPQERVASLEEAVELFVHCDVVDGGVHDLVREHDGDGWNEPLSASYSCSCGEWLVHWVQSDREQSGRPDTSDVLCWWATHVESTLHVESERHAAEVL